MENLDRFFCLFNFSNEEFLLGANKEFAKNFKDPISIVNLTFTRVLNTVVKHLRYIKLFVLGSGER